MRVAVLCALVVALVGATDVAASGPRHPMLRAMMQTLPAEKQATMVRLTAAGGWDAPSPLPTAAASHVISVTDYGADPTGVIDSLPALNKAIAAAIALGTRLSRARAAETLAATAARSPYPAMQQPWVQTAAAPGTAAAHNITDLGGVVLDLAGGVYKVSGPVHFPPYYGGYRIQQGTLVAAANFQPASGFVLQLGELTAGRSTDNLPHSTFDVGVEQLTIDGSNVAAGGLAVLSGHSVNVGPGIEVLHFQSIGISFNGTGGSFIHQALLGQYSLNDGSAPPPTATGIVLGQAEHDCDLDMVIIWSAGLGVLSANGANRLSAIHVWNLSAVRGGRGIELISGKGRIIGCYFDFTPLVVHSPSALQVLDSFFLGCANIVFVADTNYSAVENVVISNNDFNSNNSTVLLDESGGVFRSVRNMVMEGNIYSTAIATPRSTRATLTANLTSEVDKATLSFSDVLVFPARAAPLTDRIQCTLQNAMAVAYTVETPASASLAVSVVFDSPTTGVLTCTVDQSSYTYAAH